MPFFMSVVFLFTPPNAAHTFIAVNCLVYFLFVYALAFTADREIILLTVDLIIYIYYASTNTLASINIYTQQEKGIKTAR